MRVIKNFNFFLNKGGQKGNSEAGNVVYMGKVIKRKEIKQKGLNFNNFIAKYDHFVMIRIEKKKKINIRKSGFGLYEGFYKNGFLKHF